MHAYLLIAGQPALESARRAVQQALDTALRVIPDIGADPKPTVLLIPEIGGALGVLTPRVDYRAALAQSYEADDLVAFCYGTLSGVTETARHVAELFRSSGPGALVSLDGSYTALVVNREEHRLWLATDLIGMRAPRLVHGDAAVAIASHDMMHVAAGQVSGDFDLDSVAAFVSCDWSVGGHPLVKGVVRHQPWRTLSWSTTAGASFTQSSPILPDKRIKPDDDSGISLELDRIVEEMLQATRRFVVENPVVRASLTAGLDSRGVLSLLVKAHPDELKLTTQGADSTLDVRVARKLAAIVGASHESIMPREPTLDAFEAHNRLRTFATDGMSDARRAMSSLPHWNPDRHVQAGGEGGEIFRGFFYQYFGAQGIVPSDVERLTDTLLRWRFRRVTKLDFADPGFRDRIRQRIVATLERLARLGECGYDTLDLLYLYERYAQWGSAGERATWGRRWSPYEAKPAVARGFGLPPPIGTRCAVIPRAVKRYLPARAYFTPLNGTGLMALEGDGRIRFFLRQILKAESKLTQKLSSRRGKSATAQGARSQWLVSDYTRGLLTEPGSLATDLFGASGVERTLDEQQGRRSHSEMLGRLLAAEEFRRMTRECRSPSHD